MMNIRSKKGFTLMEMLIVVAIIAILVAIAIPTFSSALTEARINTDLANVRAWYAEEVADYMLNENALGTTEELAAINAKLTQGAVTVSGTGDNWKVEYKLTGETNAELTLGG